MFITGTYIIIQTGDLCQVWGDLKLMTETMFVFLTNVVLGGKILNFMLRKRAIMDIISEANNELGAERRQEGREVLKRYNRDMNVQMGIFFFMSYLTISGWGASAEKNQLPLRAWYPYDTSKTPAFQLSYAHQCIAIALGATVDICLDWLVIALISQCCCRLRLLALSLRTLCDDIIMDDKSMMMEDQEYAVKSRLRIYIQQHHAALEQACIQQDCFSLPTFGQLIVSMFIICVTGYQLAFETENLMRTFSMLTYLINMMLQVFFYCYHGNKLQEESEAIVEATYECPWYLCGVRVRRMLVVIMIRSRRLARFTAGGITELSLPTFMSIIKASYSFFTVLQQVENEA